MSKAPPVSADISCAKLNTSANILSAFTFSLRFIFEMIDCLLKGESEKSTFFNSASMSCLRLLSFWYMMLYTVPNTKPVSFWYGIERC